MADIRISELPSAPNSISGSELVPIVQNGQTVKTTVLDLVNSPVQTQTFLTVGNEPSLANSRRLGGGLGIGLVDSGAQGQLILGLNAVSASLENASTGMIVKNSSTTVINRSIVSSGSGLSVTNGNGLSGNPTVGLTGLPLALSGITGTGFLTTSGGTSLGTSVITGTSNQITVVGGDGSSIPTISISNNPIIGGTGSITIPNGTTGQRSGSYGAVRYNSTLGAFEGYISTGWQQFSLSGGVTTFQTSLSGLSPSTSTTGAVTLSGTLGVASGGTGAVTLTGYVKGSGTSVMTATSTIPTTDLSGTITNTQLANSAITINGTSTSLGSSISVGTVTSVTGTSPVVSSGGNTPAISMPVATTSANGYLSSTDWTTFNNKGSGTVTSVAQSFTGGLISVSGSPITTSGTLALTVTGTSGGIPYFSSATTWATSAALAANALMIGGGAGVAPSTITTGTGVATALGVNVGSAGAFVTFNGALGTPSSGTVTNLTGTASININGTVGATTPTTGKFTTVTATTGIFGGGF